MKKNLINISIIILVIVEITCISLMFVMSDTDNVSKEKIETKAKNNDSIAILLEQKDGTYIESESTTWPSNNIYSFNSELSGCIDNNGNKLENILKYENGIAKVTTTTTSYCYLYFDRDKEAPTENSIKINNDDAYTTNTNVTLTLSSNGATEMCISESTTCTNWETYATSKTITLSNTLGTKTVYAYFRDEAENTSVTSDAISLYQTISTIPSQNGTLTYTGSSQTPTWSNYSTTQLTIGGTTSGTNAGSYNATFTPKANYIWSDGTKTAKTVSWKIGQAANTLTLSATSGSVTYGSTKTFTISKNTSGGALTVKSSDTSVATVSISGNTVTITSKKAGSATITVTSAATTNYKTASATYAITVNKAAGSLSVSPTTLTVRVGETGTITATRSGNGTVSATSSSTSIATVSVSGTKITVTGKAAGTATITVKVAAGTNHTAPTNKTVSVTVKPQKLYLYNYGDTMDSITGGWGMKQNWSNLTNGIGSFKSTYMYSADTGEQYGNVWFVTKKEIDFSDYTYLYALIDVTNTYISLPNYSDEDYRVWSELKITKENYDHAETFGAGYTTGNTKNYTNLKTNSWSAYKDESGKTVTGYQLKIDVSSLESGTVWWGAMSGWWDDDQIEANCYAIWLE